MELWPPSWPDITDLRVLEVVARVPRAEFVPADLRAQAFLDQPLPIGYGQAISQPYVVALMTQLLELETTDRVLEIGTGCGYQTAILAELAGAVFSVEMIEPLARSARKRLQRLGYTNVEIRKGDGALGWLEHAPYDAIMVTAAPEKVPPALIDQLAAGGRLVIPVGPEYREQMLQLIEKERGQVRTHAIAPVRFVPLLPGTPTDL